MQKIEPLPLEHCSLKIPPQPDEMEVSLFGKGVGESIVIHFGDGRYAIIDSFINSKTNDPIAIEYLQAMGVSLNKVELVIATHWHSDHTAGLTKILEKASNDVKFVTYPMIREERFNQYIEAGTKSDIKSTKEFSNILDFLINRKCKPIYALHNRVLYNVIGEKLSHRNKVCFTALSPQDEELTKYLYYLNMPNKNDISYSFPDDNEISIVIWLQIGDNTVLLGGDLEEREENTVGWKAVIQNHSLDGKADLFKVPHHGSISSHNKDVWSKLINTNPISILSVFNNSGLPKSADKSRIKEYSSETFIVGSPTKKAKDLNRLIKKLDIKIETFPSKIGIVRARKKIVTNGKWNIEQFGFVESL
jgi:beta-lactamase superfamily II metal-dependent hydrolase